MKKETSITVYDNVNVIRLHNRRIIMQPLNDRNAQGIRFDSVSPDYSIPEAKPAATCEMIRGNMMRTTIIISDEAFEAMIEAYQARKNREKIELREKLRNEQNTITDLVRTSPFDRMTIMRLHYKVKDIVKTKQIIDLATEKGLNPETIMNDLML